MGFLDDAKKKLTDAVDKHGDKINQGIDKAAAAADKRTGGKHSDKIAQGVGKAKQALDGLDGRRDGDLTATGSAGQPGTGPTPDPNAPSPGPTGPSDPGTPTAPTDPKAPTGPMGDGTPDSSASTPRHRADGVER